MNDEERLKDMMAALRAEDSGRGAPAFTETRLRAAFREHHAVSRKPRPAWKSWAAAMAAVAATVAMVAVRLSAPQAVDAPVRTSRPAAIARSAPTPPANLRAAVAADPPVETKPAAGETAARRRPRTLRSPAASASAPVTEAAVRPERAEGEFIMLPYAPPLPPQSWGQVMRVSVPRQSLRSLGLPINEERFFERVPADLLLGEDGVPRAIRIVHPPSR